MPEDAVDPHGSEAHADDPLPEHLEAVTGHRLSRRGAMKAAVAGGVAAAAWAEPRVEGFSIAPDFAAAASCTTGSDVDTINTTTKSRNCTFTNNCDACVNDLGGGNGSCIAGFASGVNCGSTPRNGTLSIPRIGSGANFDANYAFLGSAWNGAANLSGVISGVDEPFVNCGVTLNGTCTGGACSFGTGSGYTKNGNGTFGTPIDFNCNGGGCSENNRCNTQSITLTLTLACTCT